MFRSDDDIFMFMKQIADILRISNQFGVFGEFWQMPLAELVMLLIHDIRLITNSLA